MSRDFPGTAGDGLSVAANDAVGITGHWMAMHCWVWPRTIAQSHLIGIWGTALTSKSYWLRLMADGTVQAGIADAAGVFTVQSSGTLTFDTWNSVAMSFSYVLDGDLGVFLDGSLDNTGNTAKDLIDKTRPFDIGKVSGETGDEFDGLIGEVALWWEPLADKEIYAVGHGLNPQYVATTNLVGYWPLWGTASPEPEQTAWNDEAVISGTVPGAVNHPPVGPFAFPQMYSGTMVEALMEDAATIPFKITPSGVETGPTDDAATVPLKITPSGADVLAGVDSATVYFKITPSGVEVHEKPCWQGEGFPDVRWEATEADSRWEGVADNRFTGVLEIGAVTC